MTDATLEQDHDMQDTPPPSKSGKRKRLFLIFGGAIVLIALCWWIWATFIAGDTAETRAQAADWLARIGFAPIDFGPLRNAAVLENTAILWIHLALAAGHGRDFVIGKIAR